MSIPVLTSHAPASSTAITGLYWQFVGGLLRLLSTIQQRSIKQQHTKNPNSELATMMMICVWSSMSDRARPHAR